jgi:hypothetical protein
MASLLEDSKIITFYSELAWHINEEDMKMFVLVMNIIITTIRNAQGRG